MNKITKLIIPVLILLLGLIKLTIVYRLTNLLDEFTLIWVIADVFLIIIIVFEYKLTNRLKRIIISVLIASLLTGLFIMPNIGGIIIYKVCFVNAESFMPIDGSYNYNSVEFEDNDNTYSVNMRRNSIYYNEADNYIYDTEGNQIFELIGDYHSAMFVSEGYLYYNYGIIIRRYGWLALSGCISKGWRVTQISCYARVNLSTMKTNERITANTFLKAYDRELNALIEEHGAENVSTNGNNGMVNINA